MTTKSATKVLRSQVGPFSFAIFLLGIRATMNLTQAALAKKLGISKSAVCEIEKGRTLVSPEAAVRYARKAGFSLTVAIEACLQDQLTKAKIKKRVRLEDAA